MRFQERGGNGGWGELGVVRDVVEVEGQPRSVTSRKVGGIEYDRGGHTYFTESKEEPGVLGEHLTTVQAETKWTGGGPAQASASAQGPYVRGGC